jgi:transcription antitermination factor NusG
MVMFGDDYATLDQQVVDFIARRLSQAQRRDHMPFSAGQRVRLRPGHPFAALGAVFEQPLSEGKRAAILLETLGRLVRCEVAMDDWSAPTTANGRWVWHHR